MKLSTMVDDVDPVVLDRGRHHLLEGRILSLKPINPGVYHAIVEGYDPYNVEIEIGEEGEIFNMECDCPYDFGPVCKHEVAVLLKLSGESSPTKHENFGTEQE